MLFNITSGECSKLKYETLIDFDIDHTSLQLDAGWVQSESDGIIDFRKGYSVDARLEDIDVNDKLRGNYCVIQYTKSTKTWALYHDSIRGFPIYYDKINISNIEKLERGVRPNELIEMVDSVVSLGHYERIKFHSTTKLPIAEATEMVELAILTYIVDFKKYNDDQLYVNPTFGYDTNTLRAVMEYHNVPHILHDEMQRSKPKHPLHSATNDPLYELLRSTQWGFGQLYVSEHPQTLVTGFWGDEYLMRGPKAVYYYLKQFGMNFKDEVEKRQDSYMYNFISSNYFEEFEKCVEDATSGDVARALMCDYQMWGFNNTQTLVPYKNIDLLEIGFRLSPDDTLDQALNARIQHDIIEKCNATLLDRISTNKNE